MNRDYTRFDGYLNELTGDVYAQPPDKHHHAWGLMALEVLLPTILNGGAKTVLDVGCGQAVFAHAFEARGMQWTGVTIGEDFAQASILHGNVHEADMTFLPFPDASFDVVFARHVIEHSPFPVITLMELRRVCHGHLILIVPAPDFWLVRGRNHYSVLGREHWLWLLDRAGWHSLNEHEFTFRTTAPGFVANNALGPIVATQDSKEVEYWFLCEAAERVTE